MSSSELSIVSGSTETSLLETTIGDALQRTASTWPDNDAIVSVHQNKRISYQQLNEQAEELAAGFLALGLKPGDRVGVWATNCVEWALTQFATAKVGLIQVNVNPAYRLHELEYALNKVGCRALVLMESYKTSLYAEMLETLAPELKNSEPGSLKSKKLPDLEIAIVIGEARPGYFVFDEVMNMGNARHMEEAQVIGASLKNTDAINIQFTSGTTGSPKGATLTHRNILNNGLFTAAAMRLKDEDRICIPVPLYHCFGMVMGNLGAITHGATIVYPDFGFEPKTTLQAVEKEKCTVLYGVPTMFVAELAEPDLNAYDLTSLRTGIMAGSLCPEDVMRRVIDEMNMSEVTIAYGMTETSPVSFQSSVDDSVHHRVTTVGKVHPHVEVKVVDEEGATVPRDVHGELLTRGYSVMQGYWADEEKTAESIDEEGWMHTGDLGVIDADGYGSITGRLKDMAIRGGENIYPKEVEDFLYTHPAVMEVQVFGVPDEKYGEEICAWIKTNSGQTASADEIKAFCKDKIAHYKVPRYIEFVDEFPMTVTGKFQKFMMRDNMVEKLGL